MIKKNLKNLFIFIKTKKKKNLKSSIIQNNQLEFKKNLFLNIKVNEQKKKKISQINLKNKKIKKKIYITRWELYSLYNSNNLINFKK